MTGFTPDIGLLTAMTDPRLFGKVFASPSFWTWRVVAKLIDGEPLREAREIELFKQCTGRHVLPSGPVRRLYLLVWQPYGAGSPGPERQGPARF